MNLLQRIYRVRDSEVFNSLEPQDRSFIGLMIEECDGHYIKGKEDEAKVAHHFTWEMLSRFRRIEEVCIGK